VIDTNTFRKTAYFEELAPELAFLGKIKPFIREGRFPIGRCRYVPTVQTLAQKMNVSPDDAARGLSRLIQLRWVRKYVFDGKTAYVLGSRDDLFLAMELRSQWARAGKTKSGRVRATEWRWLPVVDWSAVTLWRMIQDKFWDRKVLAGTLNVKGRVQITKILSAEGPVGAKKVADFFVRYYGALKAHYNWRGNPTPGLFRGFYFAIKDIMLKGVPHKKVYAHDRGDHTALAGGAVDEVWQTLG